MKTVEETARLLAAEHTREDDDIELIVWVPADEEVRLIEVTRSITDRGEVLPFRFTADPPDVLFPTVVILLGQGDWEQVSAKELELPEPFRRGHRVIFSKPAAAAHGI